MVNLKGFRKENNLLQKDVADYLGVSREFVSLVESGKALLPYNHLHKLQSNENNWDTTMLQEQFYLEKRPTAKKREPKRLPVLSFSAVAGHMGENNSLDANGEFEHCVIPEFSARGADFLIRVDGDSMYPRYANGELLAVRIIDTPTFFQWGRVYVMSTNQGCVVKKIFPDPDNDDNILCHSENCENYPDYTIPKADVIKFAIVVGHAGID